MANESSCVQTGYYLRKTHTAGTVISYTWTWGGHFPPSSPPELWERSGEGECLDFPYWLPSFPTCPFPGRYFLSQLPVMPVSPFSPLLTRPFSTLV